MAYRKGAGFGLSVGDIFNWGSTGVDIAGGVKDLFTGGTPTVYPTSSYYQQTQTQDSGSDLFSTENLLKIAVVGIGAFALFKAFKG